MGLTATEAAYRFGIEWKDSLLNVISSNYYYMKDTLESEIPDIVVYALEGTYLPMLDLRSVVPEEQVHNLIQNKCRIAVDYGEVFGECARGFIRLNLATEPRYVKTAVERIIENLK